MQESKVFKKNPDVVSRVIDDETILMPLYKSSREINCIYTLNTAAAYVWEAFDGKRSLNQIKAMVLKKFATTPKETDKEMGALVKDFKKIRAVI